MHSRWCYARLHKYHHHYRSPGPFDDMFIHPLEAMGYYFILYSPAYVLRLHVQTFFVYMALLGTFGVLDHSGIRFSIPGLYATEDHDRHHSHFEVNYAFPFPYLDLLCGTYSGTFLGRHYCDTKALERVRRRQQGGKGGGGKPGTEGIVHDRGQKGLIKEQ
jgi:sterol desaturase/sphingolipid hydroxylase (fatty acid hydroxylase superfamily)